MMGRKQELFLSMCFLWKIGCEPAKSWGGKRVEMDMLRIAGRKYPGLIRSLGVL